MIGIVLLNYNSWYDLYNCIISINKSEISTNYKIYVIDNNSKIKCENSLLNKIINSPNVSYYQNDTNRGYSAGNNVGIKMALDDGCDTILISNTDVLYHKNSIDGMYKRISKDESIGIIGPQILYKGKIQHITRYYKTKFKQKFFATTFLRFFYSTIAKEYYGLGLDENEEKYAHDVSGCCFMVSKKCAMDTMPLDEHTFLFEEELIWGERCRLHGYKVLYYPKIAVIHNHSGSTKTAGAFSYTKGTLSEIYYCKKYLNAHIWQIAPLYLIRILSYLLRLVNSRDYRVNLRYYLKETVKGLFMAPESFNK